MATLSITNTFVAGTTIVASEVNTNFSDVSSYINARNNGTTDWDFVSSSGVITAKNGITASGANITLSTSDDTRITITDTGDSSTLILRSDGANTQVGTSTNHNLNLVSNGEVVAFLEDGGDGATNILNVSNTNNTASSQARLNVEVAGGSAGDAYSTYQINGAQVWSLGLDNSSADNFSISNDADLANNKAIVIDSGTTGVSIRGTNTNDSASSAFVGEYIESIAGATNHTTTTNWEDVTSISLTAGDWDITGTLQHEANGATWTQAQIGVSTTAGNSATGLTLGSNFFVHRVGSTSTVVTEIENTVPTYRLSLSSTTTVYLKHNWTFSAGTPRSRGRISARRVR